MSLVRPVLVLLAAACAAAGLAGIAAASRGGGFDERGIVQWATPTAVALRTLDGGLVVAAVDARTRITVDGRRAGVADVQRGVVVLVRVDGGDRGAPLRARQILVLTVRSAAPAGKIPGNDDAPRSQHVDRGHGGRRSPTR